MLCYISPTLHKHSELWCISVSHWIICIELLASSIQKLIVSVADLQYPVLKLVFFIQLVEIFHPCLYVQEIYTSTKWLTIIQGYSYICEMNKTVTVSIPTLKSIMKHTLYLYSMGVGKAIGQSLVQTCISGPLLECFESCERSISILTLFASNVSVVHTLSNMTRN